MNENKKEVLKTKTSKKWCVYFQENLNTCHMYECGCKKSAIILVAALKCCYRGGYGFVDTNTIAFVCDRAKNNQENH